MYESPITTIVKDLGMKVAQSFDDAVEKELQGFEYEMGVHIDRDELIKALKYDRDQYDKGYEDGKADAVQHGHWIIVADEWDCELAVCSVCCEEFHDGDNDTIEYEPNYCPNCGALMDGEVERPEEEDPED